MTLWDSWDDSLDDTNSTEYQNTKNSTEELVSNELGHIGSYAGMSYFASENSYYRRQKRDADSDYGIAKVTVTDFRKSDSGNVLAFVSVIYYAVDLPDIPTADNEVKKLRQIHNFSHVMGKGNLSYLK